MKNRTFIGVICIVLAVLTTFVVSDLLGGGKILLIGNVIEQEFMRTADWNLGSGLSLVLMCFVIISMIILNHFDDAANNERSMF